MSHIMCDNLIITLLKAGSHGKNNSIRHIISCEPFIFEYTTDEKTYSIVLGESIPLFQNVSYHAFFIHISGHIEGKSVFL